MIKKKHQKLKKEKQPAKAKNIELDEASPDDKLIKTVVASITGEAEVSTSKKLKPSEKPHYVNSKQFEDEIRKYYKSNVLTDYLADAIRRIAYGLSFAPNFINYSYRDEMMGDAIVKMYQALKYKKFKLDHGFSPFSYFTTIAFHAFISRIKKEKKHHQIIADFRERNYDSLINRDEEETGIRVCSKDHGVLDNSIYNQSNA